MSEWISNGSFVDKNGKRIEVVDATARADARDTAERVSQLAEEMAGQTSPESFGAKGDGVTDDAAAIAQALASGRTVVFDGTKTYAVGSTITIPADAFVDFRGATIVPKGNHDVFRVKPGARIENLIVKCTDVSGWDSSVMVFYAGDKFSASNPTRINNIKLYNDVTFNDGVANSGNGFYLYADEYGQSIEGLSVVDAQTCGFNKGVYVYSSVPNETAVDDSVFIGGNVFRGYWSYRDTYGIYIDAKLPNNRTTNNFFTDLNVQSDYYGGSVNAIWCNGYNNYFSGCLYDYDINVNFQPNTAVHFIFGSQQNVVEVTGGRTERAEWCIDEGGLNRVVKRNIENAILPPYANYDTRMIGLQDDALAFIDKSATCTLESLDGEPLYGDVSCVFDPNPAKVLTYHSSTADTDTRRAVITVNLKKALKRLSVVVLQFGKRAIPTFVKVTLYGASKAATIYNTRINANRLLTISPEFDEFEFVSDVAKITVELGGFAYPQSASNGAVYGEWQLQRIMAVDSYGTGNTWLRRDGGEVYGNIKFGLENGIVLTAENGKKYLLSVSDSGTLTTEEYIEQEEEAPEVAALAPTMAARASWYDVSSAGAEQSSITSIAFNASYEPTGNEDASWACDEDGFGYIMAYRNGTAVTITPTTGSENIRLNMNSDYMFANDGTNATFSSLSSVTGTDMWVASYGTFMQDALQNNTLITAPIHIPDGVIAINRMFYSCSALLTAPVIPDSVSALDNAFISCAALKTMPNVPESAKTMRYFVFGCASITDCDIVIPAGVVNLDAAFRGCKKLNGNIEINATSLTNYADCFLYTCLDSGAVTLTGTSPYLAQLAATNTQGKVTVAS